MGTCAASTGSCKYDSSYADGTFSQGALILETLTLGSTNGSPVQIPGIAIGCGLKNHVLVERGNPGVVGLGRGLVSLINQLGPSMGGKFSYCLVPALSQPNSSGKLNFGNTAVVSGPGTVSTPLHYRKGDVFYYLNLQAFSVGTNRIEFGNSLGNKLGGKGNIIIDSGTTLTFLPTHVYSKVESTLAKTIKLPRAKDPNEVSKLCFKSRSDKIDVPVITTHFSGADVLLYAINTFVKVTGDVVCFTFVPSRTGAIFGNLAQQNMLVGYDLQKNTVSFKPMDCTKQ